MSFCHECGAALAAGHKFCKKCGTKNDSSGEDAPPKQRPTQTASVAAIPIKKIIFIVIGGAILLTVAVFSYMKAQSRKADNILQEFADVTALAAAISIEVDDRLDLDARRKRSDAAEAEAKSALELHDLQVFESVGLTRFTIGADDRTVIATVEGEYKNETRTAVSAATAAYKCYIEKDRPGGAQCLPMNECEFKETQFRGGQNTMVIETPGKRPVVRSCQSKTGVRLVDVPISWR